MVALVIMVGRTFILLTTILGAIISSSLMAESPVRGKYIAPPASAKPKPTVTPSPSPNTAAVVPCDTNLLDDTCRIPSSDPIGKKPDAGVDASSSKRPDAKIDPIKAPPATPTPAPQKKTLKKK